MPMMHPEDEANSDAPLVPHIRPTNRTPIDDPTARQTARPLREPRFARTDAEPIRRELAAIRERLSALETRLADERERTEEARR